MGARPQLERVVAPVSDARQAVQRRQQNARATALLGTDVHALAREAFAQARPLAERDSLAPPLLLPAAALIRGLAGWLAGPACHPDRRNTCHVRVGVDGDDGIAHMIWDMCRG
jgi:hypothetical protein